MARLLRGAGGGLRCARSALGATEPQRFGTALIRATGSPAYVAAFEPLPDAPDEEAAYRALGLPWCPPELREEPFGGEPPALVEPTDMRGDLHCHTTWSDGRASVEEMGHAARERGYDYLAICDHTPAVGAVRGLTPDDVRRQAEEIAAANELLAPFRVLRGIECDILPDGRLDLPDDVLSELDWVQASVHAGQRMPRAEMTKRVEEALRNPYVRCLSHPKGRISNRRPENALDLERVFDVALDEGVALEVNGLPDRLDLRGDHPRALDKPSDISERHVRCRPPAHTRSLAAGTTSSPLVFAQTLGDTGRTSIRRTVPSALRPATRLGDRSGRRSDRSACPLAPSPRSPRVPWPWRSSHRSRRPRSRRSNAA